MSWGTEKPFLCFTYLLSMIRFIFRCSCCDYRLDWSYERGARRTATPKASLVVRELLSLTPRSPLQRVFQTPRVIFCQSFFFYYLVYSCRTTNDHPVFWFFCCGLSSVHPRRFGCSLRAAMFWFRLPVESLLFFVFFSMPPHCDVLSRSATSF